MKVEEFRYLKLFLNVTNKEFANRIDVSEDTIKKAVSRGYFTEQVTALIVKEFAEVLTSDEYKQFKATFAEVTAND